MEKKHSPFTYIGKGLLIVFKAIFSFIKYVFLGLFAIPTMIVKLFSKNKKDKVTIVLSFPMRLVVCLGVAPWMFMV